MRKPRPHTAVLKTSCNAPPKCSGVFYTGSDDGVVSVSKDAGKAWQNITSKMPGFPAGAWVSEVVPSRSDAGTVYVTVDNHRLNDFGTGGDDSRLNNVVDGLVPAMLEAREAARARKDFTEADRIRDALAAAGVVLEDTPAGPRWRLA